MWREVARRCITLRGCSSTYAAEMKLNLVKNIASLHSCAQFAAKYGNSIESEINSFENNDTGENKKDCVLPESSVSDDMVLKSSGKYKVFREEDSVIIFDVEEERRKVFVEEHDNLDEFEGINLSRGIEGVFDLQDLVDVLQRQKAQDIFVVKVPKSLGYVSQMVIATGRSTRHLQAIAEFVRKVHKKKKNKHDPYIKVEGEDSKNWKALDLGNIALHMFLKSTREMYDLESLWALGAEYDNLIRKPDDPLIELLKTPVGIEGLEPVDSSSMAHN